MSTSIICDLINLFHTLDPYSHVLAYKHCKCFFYRVHYIQTVMLLRHVLTLLIGVRDGNHLVRVKCMYVCVYVCS